MQSPPIIVISGASGSGKTSLCRLIADAFGFHYGVSHTTRPRRSSEVEGRDYHFVSRAQFDQMVKNDLFLEWAEVYGNFYGTSREEVHLPLSRKQGVILDVDTQGALNLKKKIEGVWLVFVKTPSHEELKARLKKRGTEPEDVLHKRLTKAGKEESFMTLYHTVIVNDDLDRAFKELCDILKTKISCSNSKMSSTK